MGAALSTLCFLVACNTRHVVQPLPTPPERLVCEGVPASRPSVPPEYVIDWSRVTSVPQARAEHERYVATIRTREGITVGYILDIEGRLFTCHSNVQWRRDFEAGIGNPQ